MKTYCGFIPVIDGDLFFSIFPEIAKIGYKISPLCLSFRLSARMELLGSRWTDFREVCIEGLREIFRQNSNYDKIRPKKQVFA
jgi:hypothetical protein